MNRKISTAFSDKADKADKAEKVIVNKWFGNQNGSIIEPARKERMNWYQNAKALDPIQSHPWKSRKPSEWRKA